MLESKPLAVALAMRMCFCMELIFQRVAGRQKWAQRTAPPRRVLKMSTLARLIFFVLYRPQTNTPGPPTTYHPLPEPFVCGATAAVTIECLVVSLMVITWQT